MELTKQILTKNDCYRAARTIKPQGIMVHSTGVAQPDVSVFLRTWNVPDYPACVHAFVHTRGAVQTLPWTHRGWHAGTGTSGQSANNTHISFEICEPAGHTYNGGTMLGYDTAKNAAYFESVYQNAVALCVQLCEQFGLAADAIICHSEGYARGIASNHSDVMHWFPKHRKDMDTFRADVAQAIQVKEAFSMQEQIDRAVDRAMQAWQQAHLYKTAADLPDWGKQTVARMVADGVLQGDENGALNLSQDLLRALVVIDRLMSR